MDSIFECSCGSPLEITYDYNEIEKVVIKEDFRRTSPNHWKYWAFYPMEQPSKAITMDEGGTPLIKSKKNENLMFKYEGVNPTGSFKDRGSTVEISKAAQIGIKEIWCATTGNMGASVAAYCARAGIKANIVIPKSIPKSKIDQIISYGAEVKRIAGNYDKAFKFTKELRKKKRVYLVGDYPFRGEGEKSVGFEIADQLHFEPPDWVIEPIGNGTLLYSTFKAFYELAEIGLINRIPKFAGIQAVGCSPVYNAWKEGKDEISQVKRPKTIASAIIVGNPIDGPKALFAIRKSRGVCEKVSDKEIIQAQKELALEGIYAEAGGAVAYAGAKKLKLEGKVVVLVTGHGLKER